MAGETSIIREFLVALGFRTDEAALKNFTGGITTATKAVFALGAAIEATAVAVVAGVQRFASDLEQLYFASLRTGSAVTSLKAFDRAAQDFGASAGEGLAAVEGLAHALRTNPGNEGLLESKIGPLKRLRDGSVDTQNAIMRLVRPLSQMPMYMAEQYAGMFGISEKVLLAMRSGDFVRDFERIQRELNKAGFDKAAKDAHAFMNDLRSLGDQLMIFAVQVQHALQNRLQVSLKSITEWLKTNGPWLADQVVIILLRIVDVAETVGKWVAWLIGKFVEWNDATDGWSTRILGVLAVLKLFGGAEIITGILGLAGSFITLTTGVTGAAAAFGALLTAATAWGAWKAGHMLYDKMSVEGQTGFGEFLTRTLAKLGNTGAAEALASQNPLQFILDRSNFSPEQAIGILANLKAESGLDPNKQQKGGPGYGLAQWDAKRQGDFAKVFGHDIHGTSSKEQLDFLIYEMMRGQEQRAGLLLRGQTNAASAARVVADQYERHGRGAAETERRAQSAMHLEQETNIHIHGVDDPQRAGEAAAAKQDKVNASLVRNFATVK